MENMFKYQHDLDGLHFTSRQKSQMITQLKDTCEERAHSISNPKFQTVQPALNPQMFHKVSRKRVKKIRFAFALAAIISILSVTVVSAAYLLQWNGKLVDKFSVNEQQQSELAEIGAFASADQTVTKNGVTITAIQTLGDSHGIYVLFDVKAPESYEFTKAGSGISMKVVIEGAKQVSWSSSFVFDNKENDSFTGVANERYYELWLNNSQGEDWNGKTISVEFADIRDLNKEPDDNIVIAGKWNLSWKLSYMNEMQTYDINKSYTVNRHEVLVKTVEISPLSMTLKLGGSGLEELVSKSDLKTAGGLCSVSLRKKDNTTIQEGPRREAFIDYTYTQEIRFGQVQDMDQLTGFILTFYHETKDNTIEVTLP